MKAIYNCIAMLFLCAASVVMVSCSGSVQDNLNDEVTILSGALDTLMDTTEDNADAMLARLEKLEQKLKAVYEERSEIDADEFKKAYLSSENTKQRQALSERLNEVCPAFSIRCSRAADSEKMRAVFDKALAICRGIGDAG